MAERTTLRIEGVEDALLDIRRIRNRADNTPAMYRKIGTFMRQVFGTQFNSQGRFLGTPWEPLKPSYKRWKAVHSGSGRILVFTGDLKTSYTRKYAAYQHITPEGAEYGSANKIAPFHEFGTHRRKVTKHGRTGPGDPLIPARPVAVVNDYVRDGVKNIIADYIMQNPRSRSGGSES